MQIFDVGYLWGGGNLKRGIGKVIICFKSIYKMCYNELMLSTEYIIYS